MKERHPHTDPNSYYPILVHFVGGGSIPVKEIESSPSKTVTGISRPLHIRRVVWNTGEVGYIADEQVARVESLH